MYPMSRAAKIKMLRKSRPINFSSKAFTLCNTNEENELLESILPEIIYLSKVQTM